MATVRLGRYEIEEYGLPPVCARCGATAVTRPRKRFAWHPGWATAILLVCLLLGAGVVLVYVIVALVLTRRMTVALPLCRRHRNYWRNRVLFTWGGFLAVGILVTAELIVAALLDEQSRDSVYVLALLSGLIGFVIWLLVAAVLQGTGIRPGQITARGIELIGVSRDFAEAVHEDRRGEYDDDDDEPRRRRDEHADQERVERREELDERPRRRRPADAEDGGYYDPDAKRGAGRADEDDQ